MRGRPVSIPETGGGRRQLMPSVNRSRRRTHPGASPGGAVPAMRHTPPHCCEIGPPGAARTAFQPRTAQSSRTADTTGSGNSPAEYHGKKPRAFASLSDRFLLVAGQTLTACLHSDRGMPKMGNQDRVPPARSRRRSFGEGRQGPVGLWQSDCGGRAVAVFLGTSFPGPAFRAVFRQRLSRGRPAAGFAFGSC